MVDPRIDPGSRDEIGVLNAGIVRLLGLATGGRPPNIFTTLARHRRLFRRWLWFAGALMPGGRLPRRETELVILRVAHNTDCEYEWGHHERLGRRAGLSAEEIARVREGAAAPGWSERRALLLSAADELHETGEIGDPLWERLRGELDEVLLIELCMLVGHYEMLAMTLRSLRVAPDHGPGRAQT
ncbi:MAG TPA: carboxymuconolactone decarboxylase family protein [Solirubrobacterales bacterium]